MDWEHEYDVVVIGSGAGGLTAAVTARARGLSALVVEKTDRFGGSTSLPGGACWGPNNLNLEQPGRRDTPQNPRAYLDATVGDRVPAERKDAYLARGPEMLRFLHDNTRWVRFVYTPGYSDYYPELPGGKAEGRSVEPCIVDGRRLGPEFGRLRRAGLPTYGLTMTSADFGKLNMVTRTWKGKRTAVRVGMRAAGALLTGRRLLSLGEALVARLRLALAEAGGELLAGAVAPARLTRVGEEDDRADDAVGERVGVAVRVVGLRALVTLVVRFVGDERDGTVVAAERGSCEREAAGRVAVRLADRVAPALRVAAVVDLVEDHQRASRRRAGMMLERVGGALRVRDHDTVVVRRRLSGRVGEVGVERDAV